MFFAGLPTIFHIFAHSVPIEERSRAFGYLVAAGSVGQTVASIVSRSFITHLTRNKVFAKIHSSKPFPSCLSLSRLSYTGKHLSFPAVNHLWYRYQWYYCRSLGRAPICLKLLSSLHIQSLSRWPCLRLSTQLSIMKPNNNKS